MTFDQIERILGESTVQQVQAAVEAAFIASRSQEDGPRALDNLLIALLVSVIVTPQDFASSESRVAACQQMLDDLARMTKRLYEKSSDRELN